MNAKSRFGKIVDHVLEFYIYTLLSYILSGCSYGFRHNIGYVIISGLEVFVFCSYWDRLREKISNKLVCVLIMAASFLVRIAASYYIGILDVAPVLKKF